MKQFLAISSWEFKRHFKSKSFFLATFISPLLFVAILLIPSLFLNGNSNSNEQIINFVEYDTTKISEKILDRLVEAQNENSETNFLRLSIFKPDTSLNLAERFIKEGQFKTRYDSLEDAYNTIKERRNYVFQKPKTPSREALLKATYEELIETREARDLALLDYQQLEMENDSLWREEVIQQADDMVLKENISGYLLIDSEDFAGGTVEFHSLLPTNFLQIQPLKEAVQSVMVEEKMKQHRVQVDQIREWLKPVQFKEIQLQGEKKEEFNFAINYLGPIVLVLFLFISIFSSSGFLFSGIIKEKINRVIEVLLSSVTHTQLIGGKILGLGLLGIFQILIWYTILLSLIIFNVLHQGEIVFFTLKNIGIFLLYFVLGYLFFASVFVGIGSLFSHEEDAHHLNQFMRMLSIFPIVLALFVLESPNSLLVRILSFIPPLTPTFMILRTPLGNPPPVDHYIAVSIMIISIGIGIVLAGRLFKIGSTFYGKKASIREIFRMTLQHL